MRRSHYPRSGLERCLLDIEEALGAVHQGLVPKFSCIAWPERLDRTILLELPVRTRTRNCIQREKLAAGRGPLTVKDLLRLPDFGRTSLRDLLETLERFLKECIVEGPVTGPDTVEANGEAQEQRVTESRKNQDAQSRTWERTVQLLGSLFAAAAELQGVDTVGEVLDSERSRLAGKIGISTEIGSIRVEDLVGFDRGPLAIAMRRVEHAVDEMSVRERTVAYHRLACNPSKTLEAVGSLIGVTRERVRQLQKKITWCVSTQVSNEVEVAASVLKEQLDPIITRSELDRRTGNLLSTSTSLVKGLLQRELVAAMSYKLEGDTYVSKPALEVVERIRSTVHGLVDDVGLVDEAALIAELPNPDWHRFWPWVRGRIGLREVCGSVGIRDSAKARAKAALIGIGRPATRREVADISGLEERQISGALSNIASVVKASKDRWGLKEWVDDEYDGIVGEIIQRINEDGGATTTARLLQELPSKFDVAAGSVHAYLQTPKFDIRDGWVSLAKPSTIRLRNLDDVIDGRDGAGAPYWTFVVESRFFDGFSVAGVPPEFAAALGCEPDGGEFVRVANVPGCHKLSVRWPLASTNGASIGYLGEPLRRLGFQPGERTRIAIRVKGVVELSREEDVGRPETLQADAILSRIKNRRRVL